MINEERRRQISFWLLWVMVNIIGLGLGWAAGEAIGQWVAHKHSVQMGVIFAGLIVEIFLWLSRGSVLFAFREYRKLLSIEAAIWVGGEMIGWLLGYGVNQAAGTLWVTAGAIWSSVLGAGMWLIIAAMLQPRPRRRWWFAAVPLWTLAGMVGAVLIGTAAITFGLLIESIIVRDISNLVGWVFAGGFIGAIIGAVTGIVFIKLKH